MAAIYISVRYGSGASVHGVDRMIEVGALLSCYSPEREIKRVAEEAVDALLANMKPAEVAE